MGLAASIGAQAVNETREKRYALLEGSVEPVKALRMRASKTSLANASALDAAQERRFARMQVVAWYSI